MKRSLAAFGGLVLAAPLILGAASATGADAPPPTVVAEGLTTPLKLALDLDGSVYVSQNFAGQLTKIARDGTTTVLHQSGGAEVGSVSAFLGSVYFTETVLDETTGSPVESYLKKIDRRGNVTQLADIRAYENQANPDSGQTYGLLNAPADCAAQVPAQFAPYTGLVDSHPYATLGTPLGTVVADAGSNALFTVDARGKVRTLAVFAPQVITVPQEAVGLGLPPCAVGLDFAFEAVPTDVELGPDGWLYVSLLPGGPEDASLGARGSVVKVHPVSGKTVTVAGGLLSATDLAVSPKGDVYVAQLFGDQVAVIKKGSSQAVPFRALTAGAAVEWAPRGIYATANAFPPGPTGQVVLLPF